MTNFHFLSGPDHTFGILTPVKVLAEGLPLNPSLTALVVKNLAAGAGDTRDADSFLEWGRSPGRGHGNPFQYSCLENPMVSRAHQLTGHRVTERWTCLKQHSTHASQVWDHEFQEWLNFCSDHISLSHCCSISFCQLINI